MIKAIIFDLYGVIVADQSHIALHALCYDSHKIESCKELFRACDLGLLTEDERNSQIADTLGIDKQEWLQAFEGASNRDEKLLSYIKELRRSYKTGLITNAGSSEVLAQFMGHGEVNAHFDVCIVSGEVGYVKPDPRIYQLCLDELDLKPEECIFTDDRADFCQAAAELGMNTIVYRNYRQFTNDLGPLLK